MIQRLCPICRLPPVLCAGFAESCAATWLQCRDEQCRAFQRCMAPPLPCSAEEKRP
jgi:hypothetical protein